MKLNQSPTKIANLELVLKVFSFFVKPDIFDDGRDELNDAECEIIADTLFYGVPIVVKSTVDYDDNGEFSGGIIYDEDTTFILKTLVKFIYLNKTAKLGNFSKIFIFDKLTQSDKQQILNTHVTIVTRY